MSEPITDSCVLKKFPSKQQLQLAVANRCSQQLEKMLKRNGKTSFIIPGGSTPGPVFEQLSNSDLDWKNISIAQSDERWVESSHSQSNQGLTERTLLINQAKNATYIAMKNTAPSPALGETLCNESYQKLISPFGLTMLGMGLDGHFASLFPGCNNLSEALRLDNKNTCIAINAHGCKVAGEYPERMSLTLRAILCSQLIILLVTGDDKLALLESAKQLNEPMKTPISALLNQTTTPIEIYWCA